MLAKIRETTRELLRPIYAPPLRVLRRRLGRNYFAHPEMELPPPYEAIQMDVERHLHCYLHLRPDEIKQIVIVGAHEADEIDRMQRVYSNAAFLCFEPNPPTYQRIVNKFSGRSGIRVSDKALGEAPGKARFYEMSMPANGSLLEPMVEEWSRFNQSNQKGMVSFEVSVSTLDQEAGTLEKVDLLWMDVQGGEGNVLKGSANTLKRTKAVFLEVAMVRSPYKGAMVFGEISALLEPHGFTCIGLGIDSWNGTGNALFVRDFGELICKAE